MNVLSLAAVTRLEASGAAVERYVPGEDVNTYFACPFVEAIVNAAVKRYQKRNVQVMSGWDVVAALAKARRKVCDVAHWEQFSWGNNAPWTDVYVSLPPVSESSDIWVLLAA